MKVRVSFVATVPDEARAEVLRSAQSQAVTAYVDAVEREGGVCLVPRVRAVVQVKDPGIGTEAQRNAHG